MSAKLDEDIGYQSTMREYRLLLFLAISQAIKKIGALCNFNMGVNGKIIKCEMSNILKMAECRAKRMKIWDSVLETASVGYLSDQVI